ncbi:MAG TPA: glycosyltransferase family 2 protein [Gammaproteobacteria bacterium]
MQRHESRKAGRILAAGQPVVFPAAGPRGPELSVIVPTFNERANVVPLVEELGAALSGIEWEVVFVDDDSPDETARAVRELATANGRVRCVQRIGRRGLSSASIEGMLASTAPYVAVMDGDLQHDPKVLPTMLDALKQEHVELVIGSRYTEGGSLGEWDRVRAFVSRLATWLGRAVVPATLKDPMSGFFVLRRSLFDAVVRDLSGLGFKILLDIFASARRPVTFREVPFVFRARREGASKLDSQAVWEYLMLLADKMFGRFVPVRFLFFSIVGAFGLGVHMLVLSAVYRFGGIAFVTGQTVATLTAMVFNYSLNNELTYRDQRRRGWPWLTGLLSFVAVCSMGAIANIGVAAYVFNRQSEWVLAAVAGVLTGAVWNYAVTNVYTWKRARS